MTMIIRHAMTVISVMWLASCGGGGSNQTDGTDTAQDKPYNDTVSYSNKGDGSLMSATENAAVTHHNITIDGKSLAYIATMGHLTATDPATHSPEASFSYAAYTLDKVAPTHRPLMFFFNGGPGTATIWLHMGSFAPRRIVTNMPTVDIPTPVKIVDNNESLIDTSDMVFVDAVGTGLSEAIAPNTNLSFWDAEADNNVTRDFIMRYVAANHRESSPLYLFGESYGCFRAARVADLMAKEGMNLKGVILQSRPSPLRGNIHASWTLRSLPSYALIAAWLGIANPAPTDLDAFRAHAESLDSGVVLQATNDYFENATPFPNALNNELAAITGIPVAQWQTDPDFYPWDYATSLLPGKTIGQLDARVVAAADSPLSTMNDGDPSFNVIKPPFQAAIDNIFPEFLAYTHASPYREEFDNPDYIWGYDDYTGDDDNVELATAVSYIPSLQILVMGGYHDIRTPYWPSQSYASELGGHARIRFYAGGHMTYLDNQSRIGEKADVVALVHDTSTL